MIEFFKSLFWCKHDFVTQTTSEKGVTLDGMNPTIKFAQRSICKKCGEFKEREFIIFGHRRMHPERYNKNGWPIDKNGHKMPIS